MKMILSVVLLICMALTVFGGQAIFIGFNLRQGDTVELTGLDIGEGMRQVFPSDSGEYQVLLVDASEKEIDSHNFSASFVLFSDPPRKLDYSSQSFRLNYNPLADRLLIRHGGLVIFEKKLPELGECNGNGVCEKGENSFGCFRDCDADPAFLNEGAVSSGVGMLPSTGTAGTMQFISAGMLLACGGALVVAACIAAFFLLKGKTRGKKKSR